MKINGSAFYCVATIGLVCTACTPQHIARDHAAGTTGEVISNQRVSETDAAPDLTSSNRKAPMVDVKVGNGQGVKVEVGNNRNTELPSNSPQSR